MTRIQTAWHTDDRLQEEMAERDHFVHHLVDLYFLPNLLSLPGKVITMAAMIVLVVFSVLGYINLEQGNTTACALRFGVECECSGKGEGGVSSNSCPFFHMRRASFE
jgi:hypothetical protein